MKMNTIINDEVIERELSIKILEYLKRKNIIEEGISSYIINKLIRQKY